MLRDTWTRLARLAREANPPRGLLSLAAMCGLIAALYITGALDFVERRWMDARFRLTERPASGDLIIVEIDPESLRRLSVWPWPRGYHATALENLLDAGARRVAFDLDFSSRSVTDEDAELERVIAHARGRVVLPVYQQWQRTADDATRRIGVRPLPELARHARLGSINVRPGNDGLVRTYDVRADLAGRAVEGFAAALLENPPKELDDFWVDFGIDVRSIPRLSYVDVLTGRFDAEVVAGRAVIIGATAIELGDQIAVPVDGAIPGPQLQGLAYESLTQDRALRRLGPVSTLFGVIALMFLLGPAVATLSWRAGLALTLGALGATLLMSVGVQRQLALIVDTSPWLLGCVAVYGYALVARIDAQALSLVSQRMTLHRTEHFMQHVVEHSFDAILTIDDDGAIITFNRAAQKVFGYPISEIVGTPVHKLIEHEDPRGALEILRRATGTPIEAVGRCRSGKTIPVEMVVTRIQADEGAKLVAFIRDITERKAHEHALEHQATHDPLTDLPNRFLLLRRIKATLEVARADSTPVAILLLDLDRFKEVNDALGHHTGDQLLQLVARRLSLPLGPTDTISRLGGDEFAVLLPESDLERARQIALQLIDMLRSPFQVDGLCLQIDTSVGITQFPEHGEDADTLLQRADVAMYVAKRKRTGVAAYDPDQDFNNVRHLMLRGDLRYAIQDNRLELVYQPKISAETEQVIGVEALLRWNHPRHGWIPPDEFIGLAEHSGLIRPLSTWVIETALRQGSEWMHRGHRLVVAVNLSARNLMEDDLPRSLERLLSVYGVQPDLLTLEITESVLMEDPERSLQVITELNSMGIDIAIDDFGTGYSSLGYLMRLPAREIKIDRSFVMQMDRDSGSATIVRSIIELAHNLGLSVVAEGVETAEVWRTLKNLGCDIGQGYYFSRPVAPAALLSWMEEHRDTHPLDLQVPDAVVERPPLQLVD